MDNHRDNNGISGSTNRKAWGPTLFTVAVFLLVTFNTCFAGEVHVWEKVEIEEMLRILGW
jgi:hypothetical protein